MATMSITPDQDVIVSEIYIAAPPERVFQALVEPQQVLQWWGQAGVYRCTEFDSDLRAGGKWRSAGVAGDSSNFTVAGASTWRSIPRASWSTRGSRAGQGM